MPLKMQPIPNCPPNPGSNTSSKCKIKHNTDGTAEVTFLIEDPMVIKRLERRSGVMDLGRWLWENVLYRGVLEAAGY